MEDFAGYVSSLPPDIINAGLCKVVPPDGWPGPRGRIPDNDTVIFSPILQHVDGCGGAYRLIPEERPRLKVARFARTASAALARDVGRACAATASVSDLVGLFWRDLESARPGLYGADQCQGTLFPPASEMPVWNLRALPDLLRTGSAALDEEVAGVTSPYLYYGAWRTIFGLHVEDEDLYSINYLHSGAPKVWVGAPARCSALIEMIAASVFSEDHAKCKHFLRHKTHLISPEFLTGNGVPLSSLTQQEGEFVITFPQAYHFGFNLGLNCAESTNFALPPWLPYAGRASRCVCPAGRGVAHIDPTRFLECQAQMQRTPRPNGRARSGVCAGDVSGGDTAATCSRSQAGPSGAIGASECSSGSSTQDPDEAMVLEADYAPIARPRGVAQCRRKRKRSRAQDSAWE